MEESLFYAFLEDLRLKGMHAQTRRAYLDSMRDFVIFIARQAIGSSFFSVGAENVRDYYRQLKEERGYAPATIYGRGHAVYAFYAWLKQTGVILVNPCPKPPGRGPYHGRSAPAKSIVRKMYRRLTDSDRRAWIRNTAIIDLFYSSGLRLQEVIGLNVEDLCPEDGTIRVRGKNGKERLVPVGERTMADLMHYLYHARPKFIKGTGEKAFFVTAMNYGRRIGKGTIFNMFRDLRQTWGVHRAITAHTLRHAFATHLLKNGAPLQDVSKMLGHADLGTTQIYTKNTAAQLKEQHTKHHPRG